MHPVIASKGRLGPYLLTMVPLYGILVALLARPGALSIGEALAAAAPMTLVYPFLGLSSWYPCRIVPLDRSTVPRLLATHGTGAVVTSALWIATGAFCAWIMAADRRLVALPTHFNGQLPVLFLAGIVLYLLSVAFHYILISFEQARQAETMAMELRVLAREAELKALKAQIHPHFLFNSLNSISALTSSDPARAREMCVLLSEFLRESLAVGERESITIEKELSLARAYLAIESIRFGSRLSFEEKVGEDSGGCHVPPLLIQPLVENAIRHGIATRVEGGLVRLSVHRSGQNLFMEIDNPFDSDSPAAGGEGRGIENVRRRLAARYGNEARLEQERLPDRFRVTIRLPAHGQGVP
jgi:hypothetical protein